VKLSLFLAGLAVSACVQTAAAQQAVLNLDELISEALRNNPEIRAAQKRYEAARERPVQQSSLPDPVVSMGYASVGSPRPVAGLGAEPMARAGVSISQEFPFPGKRKLAGEISSKDAEAEFQDYQQAQLGVISRLEQAYHRLYHTFAMVRVLETTRDQLQTIVQITEVRYSVGKAAQQDIFKAQTQLSILEARLVRLERERLSLEAEIDTVLARPPGSALGKPPDIPPGELMVTFEELLASANQNSPLLHRQEKVIQKSELGVNLARKGYYPDTTVTGGYYNMGRLPDVYEFRVDLKLPVWSWRKQRAAVAEQADMLGEARRSYEAADQALTLRIKDEFLSAQASSKLMKMYAETVIPQAGLTFESSINAYQTGAVDFLSVLSNLMTKVEYEENYHEEMLAFHLAMVRLEEMTGTRWMN
jgi:outer membrane protein TolC